MPTSMLANAAVGAATSFGGKFLSGLFGGDKDEPSDTLRNWQAPGFEAGGLNAEYGPGGLSVRPSAERMGLVRDLAATRGTLADRLAGFRGMVDPANNELARIRLQEIENARTSAIGNLRENLQRRRVLGSSFGQDALTRAEATFGQERERAAAESFMTALQQNIELAGQEANARTQQFQVGLDELNLEANLAASLVGKATEVLGKNAQYAAMLDAESQKGSTQLLGQAFQPFFKSLGKTLEAKLPTFVPA